MKRIGFLIALLMMGLLFAILHATAPTGPNVYRSAVR
jgi:hypothetical protein